MSPTQQADKLATLFVEKYEETMKRKPTDFNRNVASWGFKNMLKDLGPQRSKAVIEEFFTLPYYRRRNFPVTDLLYHYQDIETGMIEAEEDRQRRLQLREATRRMVEGE